MDPAPVGRCCGVRPLELPTDGAGIADLQQIVMRELRFEREAVLLDVRGPSFRIESRPFQSESPTGEPWLAPDILDHLRDLGAGHVLLCPIGFVSDHLEIRWDLDVEAREKAAVECRS